MMTDIAGTIERLRFTGEGADYTLWISTSVSGQAQ